MKKPYTMAALITMIIAFSFAGCDMIMGPEDEDSGPPDPLGATDGRPAIPMPSSYQGEVRTQSDTLVVEQAPAQYFNPEISAAFNSDGQNLNFESERLVLVEEGEAVTNFDEESIEGLQALPADDLPTVQFIRYWQRLGAAESFAGGAAVTRARTTTTGSTRERTESFSSTTSVEASVSAGGVFASASVTASASYTATQGFSSTETEEIEVTESFTVSPRSGTNLLYSVWQLVEEIRYVKGTGADAELYDVQAYDFNEDSLRFVFPTDEIVPVSAYYEQ